MKQLGWVFMVKRRDQDKQLGCYVCEIVIVALNNKGSLFEAKR